MVVNLLCSQITSNIKNIKFVLSFCFHRKGNVDMATIKELENTSKDHLIWIYIYIYIYIDIYRYIFHRHNIGEKLVWILADN